MLLRTIKLLKMTRCYCKGDTWTRRRME